MKLFIVILAIAALSSAEEGWKARSTEEIQAIHKECYKESPISEEQVQQIQSFVFPDEEAVRKHVLCNVKKLGIFIENEGYQPERVAQQLKADLDEAEVLALAKGCADKNEQASSEDVWAYRGHECLIATKIGDVGRGYLKKNPNLYE